MKDQTNDDFQIDVERLDQEWLRQPQLVIKHGEAHAEARHEYDKAKAAFELAKAELTKQMVDNPESFGLTKTTEKYVESAVVDHPRYRKTQLEMFKAKHDMDVAYVAVNAIEHKKHALSNEVQLMLRDYHSEPKAPDDPEFREKVEQARERVLRKR